MVVKIFNEFSDVTGDEIEHGNKILFLRFIFIKREEFKKDILNEKILRLELGDWRGV